MTRQSPRRRCAGEEGPGYTRINLATLGWPLPAAKCIPGFRQNGAQRAGHQGIGAPSLEQTSRYLAHTVGQAGPDGVELGQKNRAKPIDPESGDDFGYRRKFWKGSYSGSPSMPAAAETISFSCRPSGPANCSRFGKPFRTRPVSSPCNFTSSCEETPQRWTCRKTARPASHFCSGNCMRRRPEKPFVFIATRSSFADDYAMLSSHQLEFRLLPIPFPHADPDPSSLEKWSARPGDQTCLSRRRARRKRLSSAFTGRKFLAEKLSRENFSGVSRRRSVAPWKNRK